MFYNKFKDKEISALALGCMRLPTIPDSDGIVDEQAVMEMVDLAIKGGINYFDTALPYHNGQSEKVIGKALKKHDRDSFYLADKYPGHMAAFSDKGKYEVKKMLEKQLRACDVDYFDFYLLHNVFEGAMNIYYDEEMAVVDKILEEKAKGKIKHFGFSTHARMPLLEEYLDKFGDVMEFCQIQINFMDWTLQDAKEKYELLTSRGIPVWVMEPLRGGVLINEGKASVKEAFRFITGLDNVTVVLSGMSNMDQLKENLEVFKEKKTLTDHEREELEKRANELSGIVPCTACRYCCDKCPQKLDIPVLLSLYNDVKLSPILSAGMTVDSMPKEKQPQACIGCSACSKMCPQNIDIPGALSEFSEKLKTMPHWEDLVKVREQGL